MGRDGVKSQWSKPGIKGAWTAEEDQRLINLVRENGAKDWNYISAQLSGRVSKQCRERCVATLAE